MIHEADLCAIRRETRIADPSRRRIQHLAVQLHPLLAPYIADKHSDLAVGCPIRRLHIVLDWARQSAAKRCAANCSRRLERSEESRSSSHCQLARRGNTHQISVGKTERPRLGAV